VTELWTYLSEILYISYTEPDAQKVSGIRLRLHVLCFLLVAKGVEIYGVVAMKRAGLLFLHTVQMHYGPYFEEIDFRNGSTEGGECWFSILKPILTQFTNRHQKEALLESVIRTELEFRNKKSWGNTNKGSKVWNELDLVSILFRCRKPFQKKSGRN
jgi:hypothetical protein